MKEFFDDPNSEKPKYFKVVDASELLNKDFPLHSAICKKDLPRIKKLLDEGKNIEWKNSSGETPLLVAVEKNQFNIVKLLVERGANVNAKNNDGYTPYLYAQVNRNNDICNYLKQNGAKISGADSINLKP